MTNKAKKTNTQAQWTFELKGGSWALEQLNLASMDRTDWSLDKVNNQWELAFPVPNVDEVVLLKNLKEKGLYIKLRQQKEIAKTYVDKILGKATVITKLFGTVEEPLGFKHIRYFDGEQETGFLEISETLGIADNISITSVDGETGEVTHHPADRIRQLLEFSDSSEEIGDLLDVIARYGMDDWINLYKIYELIGRAVGKKSNIPKKLGFSDSRVNLFTKSANRTEISGDGARHAVQPGVVSKGGMSLDEAKVFVKELVQRYLLKQV